MPATAFASSRRRAALGLTVVLLATVTPDGLASGAPGTPSGPTIEILARIVTDRSAEQAVAVATSPAATPTTPPVDPSALHLNDPLAGIPTSAEPPAPSSAPDATGGNGRTGASTEVPAPEPAPSTRELIAARCPDLHDPAILRDGAALDGKGLCERSVHEARSDTAAAAVVEGFGLLGLPYSRSRRGRDGYDDCSSFVGRSYRDAGRPLSDSDWEPSSSAMRRAGWATVVDDARPGDILWRSGHVAMALADGFMMHASQSGDVTHVRSTGRYRAVLAVQELDPPAADLVEPAADAAVEPAADAAVEPG